MKRITILLLIFLFPISCTSIPEGVKPVDNLDVNRYLGTWYEVARLDHSFEAGLSDVTAEYSLRDDGGISVLNRGFSSKEGTWSSAEGKAYFVEDKTQGHLKVSFFGPFYSSYVIFELDKAGYEYAFVSGYNRDYLWLLARSPQVSDEVISNFIQTSKEQGFNTDELIFVNHGKLVLP